jgi:hypothetical protein
MRPVATTLRVRPLARIARIGRRRPGFVSGSATDRTGNIATRDKPPYFDHFRHLAAVAGLVVDDNLGRCQELAAYPAIPPLG